MVACQNNKFVHLVPGKFQRKELAPNRLVVNLSSKILEPLALSALSKGMNFIPTPLSVPVREFGSEIEQETRTLSEMQVEELRGETSCILKRGKIPTVCLEDKG